MLDLTGRNPLVNSKEKNLWFIEKSIDNAHKVYKKQQLFKKEYGLRTTLLITHFIKWKDENKNVYYVSPLLYKRATVVKNQKISLDFELEIEDELHQINPVLISAFLNQFSIKLSIENDNVTQCIETLVDQLESNGDRVELTSSFDTSANWQIIETKAVGNFNYKKSILAQDYDLIQPEPNHSVKAIFGEQSEKKIELIDLDLSHSDSSQTMAISKALTTNSVIQGPPGTGKSHTIVELIKQNLISGKNVLFVSEKKSALDIVYTKLTNENLSHLTAYFNGDKSQKKDFYLHLKRAFNQFNTLDSSGNKEEFNSDLKHYFKTYSTELLAHNTKLDTNLYELLSYLAENQVKHIEPTTKYNVPNYKLWQNYLEFMEDIEDISISKFECDTITLLPFLHFNKAVFLDQNPIQKIEKRLTELEINLDKVLATLRKFDLNWNWKQLSNHCLSATVLNMANTFQLDLLDPKSKKYKSFDTWTKKYELTKNKLKTSTELCSNWDQKPKLAEIEELIEELNQKQSKPWYKLFKKSKVEQAFSHYSGNLSTELKLKSLDNLKQFYDLTAALDELKIKLKHNLNLLNPDTDINHLLQLRQKLQSLSSTEYIYLLEQENSLELIESLHQLHHQIQQSNQIVKYIFSNYKIENIKDTLSKIEFSRSKNSLYNYYLPEIKKTLNLPVELLNYLKSNPQSVEEMTHEVVYFNYWREVKYNSTLNHLNAKDFEMNFKTLAVQNLEKNKSNRKKIASHWSAKWNTIEELLNSPTSKLSSTEKIKKQNSKLAKRTIFHELSKQQQHLPIKQLIKQTNRLIFDIQPLWIMNPLSIAENLPCEADLFDLVIFDEASQIPLEDAIPTLFRAKQTVIVGDSKQMPPSQFFSNSSETTTLLNQAESVFKSHLLTWHYRSEHPKLIQFSNHHFYDNELNYFPSPSNQNPIETIFVDNGIFEDSINRNEAKVVANAYSELVKKGTKNIGIIAFSKAQESQISKEIELLNLPPNTELLIRNLENTQGIEKDNVIISIGYGFNKEGDFRMNFGPINQDFGANRLNVLLTRAKQKMIIVSSVKSTDFKLTDNRGVSLLKDFLAYTERINTNKKETPNNFLHQHVSALLLNNKLDFNYYSASNGLAVNCFTQSKHGKILLIDPSLHLNENRDIYTLLSVIYDRFKSVKIVLSNDYLENKDRFEKEIVTFFS